MTLTSTRRIQALAVAAVLFAALGQAPLAGAASVPSGPHNFCLDQAGRPCDQYGALPTNGGHTSSRPSQRPTIETPCIERPVEGCGTGTAATTSTGSGTVRYPSGSQNGAGAGTPAGKAQPLSVGAKGGAGMGASVTSAGGASAAAAMGGSQGVSQIAGPGQVVLVPGQLGTASAYAGSQTLTASGGANTGPQQIAAVANAVSQLFGATLSPASQAALGNLVATFQTVDATLPLGSQLNFATVLNAASPQQVIGMMGALNSFTSSLGVPCAVCYAIVNGPASGLAAQQLAQYGTVYGPNGISLQLNGLPAQVAMTVIDYLNGTPGALDGPVMSPGDINGFQWDITSQQNSTAGIQFQQGIGFQNLLPGSTTGQALNPFVQAATGYQSGSLTSDQGGPTASLQTDTSGIDPAAAAGFGAAAPGGLGGGFINITGADTGGDSGASSGDMGGSGCFQVWDPNANQC